VTLPLLLLLLLLLLILILLFLLIGCDSDSASDTETSSQTLSCTCSRSRSCSCSRSTSCIMNPPTTHLARFCDGLLEAMCLAAVAIIPCLYNPFSAFAFEPDKLLFLRCLSLLIAAAWLVRWVESRNLAARIGLAEFAGLAGKPVALTLGILTLGYVVSTGAAVHPAQSFWGAYETRQGLVTYLACVLLLITVAIRFRTERQLDRLVTTILVASLPVSLYGIVQRAGMDPIIWSSSAEAERVGSLAGHPVYLAAYLAMVLPLTVWRILRLLDGTENTTGSTRPASVKNRGALAFYTLLALAQLTAFLFTESRGALLALFGGLALMAVLSGPGMHRKYLLPGGLIIVCAATLFLLLNLPLQPLEGLRKLPVVQRFAHALSTTSGTGAFRAQLWEEAAGLMLSSDPMLTPNGDRDALAILRAWIGYGPENLAGVLAQRYTIPISGVGLETRLHNASWDRAATMGIVGVTAFWLFVALIWRLGFRGLGLIPKGRENWWFGLLLFGGALGAATGLGVWLGAGFLGLGIQLGLAAGCLAFPLVVQWKGKAAATDGDAPPSGGPLLKENNSLLIIALLAGLVVHVIETGFGFIVASSAVLFWVYAGILIAIVAPRRVRGIHAESSIGLAQATNPKTWNPHSTGITSVDADTARLVWRGVLAAACLAAAPSIPLITLLVSGYSHEPMSGLAILGSRLFRGSGAVLLAVVASWLGAAYALSAGERLGPNGQRVRFLPVAAISGGILVFYTLVLGRQLAAIGPLPPLDVDAVGAFKSAIGYETACITFLGVLLSLVVVCGFGCSRPADVGARLASKGGSLMGAIAFPAALMLCAWLGFQPILADVSLKWANVLQDRRVWPGSTWIYERAIQRNQNNSQYRAKLAQAWLDQAQTTTDPDFANLLLAEAERVLEEAQTVPGYNRGWWHLGRIYIAWAGIVADDNAQQHFASKARHALDEALRWEPNNPRIWCDSASVDLTLLHDQEQGLEKSRRALEIDPFCSEAYTLMADFYARTSRQATDSTERHALAQKAADIYIEAATTTRQAFTYTLARAVLWLQLGDTEEGLAVCDEAATVASPEQLWKVDALRVQAHIKAGDRTSALVHLARAFTTAPSESHPVLLELKRRIEDLQ
jgi:tetratricopeptide (TPR) repeat protein